MKMNTIEICLVKVENATLDQLNQIVEIKKQSWPYPDKKQLEWINQNLNKDDEHVMLFVDGVLCAYLNLVWLSVELDSVKTTAVGIGNVCVSLDKRNKKYGTLLMNCVNTILIERNHIGVLLCQDKLFGFYQKNGWKECEKHVKKQVGDHIYDNNMFFYNLETYPCNNVKIDKNF